MRAFSFGRGEDLPVHRSVSDLLAKGGVRNGVPPDRGYVFDELVSEGVRWKRLRQWSNFDTPEVRILPWINLNPAGNPHRRTNDVQPFERPGAGWNMVVLSWKWGFDGCVSYNAFPFEEKSPRNLRYLLSNSGDATLVQCNALIAREIAFFDAAVAGWGGNDQARIYAPRLVGAIRSEVSKHAGNFDLWCIKKNDDGSPKNPTRTSHGVKPQRFQSLAKGATT